MEACDRAASRPKLERSCLGIQRLMGTQAAAGSINRLAAASVIPPEDVVENGDGESGVLVQ